LLTIQVILDLEDLPAIEYEMDAELGRDNGTPSRGSYVADRSLEDTSAQVEEPSGPRTLSSDPSTKLTEVVAAGAEFVHHTGDLVVEGVMNTAHMLRIDRLPGVNRILRGFVHLGFWEAYVGIRSRLHQVLFKSLCSKPSRVYFTGHSLGGALAKLAALDVCVNTIPLVESELARRAAQMPSASRRRKESKVS